MDQKGYFDNNATTPLCLAAKEAWSEAASNLWLNPSSPYRAAAQVHARLRAARDSFAKLFSCDPMRIVFNSGATEGNNMVFAHWARSLPVGTKIGVSPTEHPSVIEATKAHFGGRVEWLPLDPDGAVCLDRLSRQIETGKLKAISAMAVNNETGIINPWHAIADLCSQRDVEFHCDASQWVGKLPLDGLSGCDFLTACAHKFSGPRGVGILLKPRGREFTSFYGGEQQNGARGGTEDVAGILAMLAALEVSDQRRKDASSIGRDRFEAALEKTIPGSISIGRDSKRVWNTSCVMLPEFANERWIRALEKRGFFVSSGSACSTGKQGPSHVLAAMEMAPTAMRRVIRVSSSFDATTADWLGLAGAMVGAYCDLKEESDGSTSKVISI